MQRAEARSPGRRLCTRLAPFAAWALLQLAAPSVRAQIAADQACLGREETKASVAGIDERGELVLTDGRTVKLAGIDLPSPAPERAALTEAVRSALSRWLGGRAVTVRPLPADLDRWGRTLACVLAPADYSSPEDGPISAAAALIDAGLARVRSTAEARSCTAALLAAEATARRNRLGLWADPYYAVLDATDSTRLAEHAGVFILVEGQVARVGHGRTRRYLDFGPTRGSLSVTISKRDDTAFGAAGVDPERLIGARLRVRGVLDTRFGPQIEVSDPGCIERL